MRSRYNTCHTSIQVLLSDSKLSQQYLKYPYLFSPVHFLFCLINICPACKTHTIHCIDDHKIKHDFNNYQHLLIPFNISQTCYLKSMIHDPVIFGLFTVFGSKSNLASPTTTAFTYPALGLFRYVVILFVVQEVKKYAMPD